MAYKGFKSIYNSTNKHVDQLGQQLLTTWIDTSSSSTNSAIEVINDHLPCPDNGPPVSCTTDSAKAIVFFEKNNVLIDDQELLSAVLLQERNGHKIWKPLKSAQFPAEVRSFTTLSHKAVFGGDTVYGKINRRDGIRSHVLRTQPYALVHFVSTQTNSSIVT